MTTVTMRSDSHRGRASLSPAAAGEPDPVDDEDCGHRTKCTRHPERRRLLLPLGFRKLDVELSERLDPPSDGLRTCGEAEHREDTTPISVP